MRLITAIFILLSLTSCSGIRPVLIAKKPEKVLNVHFTFRYEKKPKMDGYDFYRVNGASPLVLRDRVIFGLDDGNIYAISRRNGERIWKQPIGASVQSPCLNVRSGLVVCQSIAGRVMAFRPDTGDEAWRFEMAVPLFESMREHEGMIVIKTVFSLTALDSRTGKSIWEYAVTRPTQRVTLASGLSLIGWNDRLISGFYNGTIAVLSATDGSLQNQVHLAVPAASENASAALLAVDELFYALNSNGLVAYGKDWSIQWSMSATDAPKAISNLDADHLIAVVSDRTIKVIQKKSGGIDELISLDDPILEGFKLNKVYLLDSTHWFLTSADNNAFVYDRARRVVIQKIDVGSGISGDVIVSDGEIFFISNHGFLYAYRYLPIL